MQPSHQSAALIVFGKNPVPGRVKTRLAKEVGDVSAALLYRSFLLDSLEVFGNLDLDLWLYLAPSETDIDLEISSRVARFETQSGEGLGQRMSNAFKDMFARGYQRVGIVGSDHPTLPVRILRRGFADLSCGHVVLGPSDDGGYYFLAINRYQPNLFKGIRYGRHDVLEATLQRAESLGLRPTILDYWYDVDTAEDLERLTLELQSETTICRHTRATMKHLGIL